MKVLGTPKPSLQWFKDDLEVETYLIIIWRLKTNLCSQVFSSDRLEIKDEEDGGSVIVREARSNICWHEQNIAGLLTEKSPG